ncbi:ABC transporter permease [Clostridium sp. KNHs214]|uniref:ABC transporter permease n=1 Tax=Clostridium sp. KNHs214 TaxID=1540257 RepID=UPI00054F7F3E|nr:ABC transporter permease [Clostridium sp. KNHs214]
MLLRYHFKQQSKIMVGISATFMVLVFIFNLLEMNREWYTLSLIITLLPVFFTANIFSSEIEKGTDFLIFTSRTPKYKVLIQKYLSAWITSESVIFIVYISALIMGFEKSMFTLMVIVIYSTLLSLIGLLISNISGNTLLGYGISLGIWAMQMLLGASWHENNPFASINVNLINKSVPIWSNIFFIVILIMILVILNLFIVSKGEHLRRKLIYKGSVTVITFSLIFLFIYNSFFMKMEFWKNDTWNLVKGQNIKLHHKNLDSDRAEELFKICDTESKILEDIFGKNICYNELYMWRGKEKDFTKSRKGVYTMPYSTLKSFNPVEYGGEYWGTYINTILLEPMFKNIERSNENEILMESWKEYIYHAYVVPKSGGKFKENKLIQIPEYYNNKEEYCESLERDLKEVKSDKKGIHALASISQNLLYKLDKSSHEKTIKLLNSIYNNEKSISYDDIKNFIENNYKDNTVEETLDLYDDIRKYHEKYYADKQYVR